ncbi:MAG: tetratricopeptide repeat protein [Burkholderiales bacterium]|nr:tetratricopeptide repeat protein [Burkholderiales bacterium]
MDSSLGFVDTPQQSLVLAEQIARQAIAIDNKDAMAHCTLGRILTALGDYSEAIAELRIAIDLNPSFALAYFGYGQCLCYDGQPAEAIPALEKAAQLSPHDPYTGLFEAVAAVAKIQLGQFDEAVRLARSATRRKGTAVWPYAALASAFGNLGRIDDAQRAVDKLLAIKADFSREVFERHWPHMSPSFKKNYYKGLCKAGLKSFCDAVAID